MREDKSLTEILREKVINAAEKSVEELIKVLEEKIIGNPSLIDETSDSGEIPPEKMKIAAQAKRVAFDDAMSILDSIEAYRGEKTGEKKEEKKDDSSDDFIIGRAN